MILISNDKDYFSLKWISVTKYLPLIQLPVLTCPEDEVINPGYVPLSQLLFSQNWLQIFSLSFVHMCCCFC